MKSCTTTRASRTFAGVLFFNRCSRLLFSVRIVDTGRYVWRYDADGIRHKCSPESESESDDDDDEEGDEDYEPEPEPEPVLEDDGRERVEFECIDDRELLAVTQTTLSWVVLRYIFEAPYLAPFEVVSARSLRPSEPLCFEKSGTDLFSQIRSPLTTLNVS